MGRQPQDKEGKVPEILAEDTTYRFYSAVSKRIRDAIEQSGMSQREIVAAMEGMGLAVNQGSISKLQDYKARDGNKRAPTLYYAFDESQIQGMEIEIMDRIRAISRLRDASAAPTYCKSSAKADELIFKYLNQMSKAN